MAKIVLDQAEGLRRLLSRDVPRIVAVVGGAPGAGGTSVVANLAAALAAQGKDVVAIEERAGPRSLSAALGVRCRYSLADVARGDMTLDAAAVRTTDGVLVLSAPRARMDSMSDVTMLGAARLRMDGMNGTKGVHGTPARSLGASDAGLDFVGALSGHPDIILIDAATDAQGALSPLAMQAHDVLLAMRVDAQSITGTYAVVKRLHYAHAIRQFRVLVNGAATASDARGVLHTLSEVASRYLAVSLSPAGAVSFDPLLMRAQALARSVVEAFPAAPAAVDFRRIAADLLHWPWRPAAQRAASDNDNDYAEAFGHARLAQLA